MCDPQSAGIRKTSSGHRAPTAHVSGNRTTAAFNVVQKGVCVWSGFTGGLNPLIAMLGKPGQMVPGLADNAADNFFTTE